MKRYLVFGGDRCYATGGAFDYLIDMSKLSDAQSYRHQYLSHNRGSLMWCHIFDTRDCKIIPSGEEDELGYTCGIS
jgi:hypothetical protein